MFEDTILLSRIQFGFTVGFHILFPTLTIGLGAFLGFVEAMWLITKKDVYLRLYRFWVKIFALAFGMGVVSGLVLSYQFGTNFSRFSDVTGHVMGPLLSVEVLTAFFVEAGFIGVMLFGWNKVGPRLHFVATLLVVLGTTNSAFWILAANSWMQTPAGTELRDGLFYVKDWWAVIFNPSFPYRLFHMVFASYLTTAFVVAGVSGWYLLKRQHEEVARKGFALGLMMATILAPVQAFVGDEAGRNVAEHQPMKVAAMEGLWKTAKGIPLIIFAIPDQENQRNLFEISIPKLSSLIVTHKWNGEVKGLNEVKRADQPPVLPVFFGFRIMVGIGIFFIFVAGYHVVQRMRKRLYDSRWLMRMTVFCVPLGFIATWAGWIVAETGRQPWTVYGLLRTEDSISPVTVGEVATSLILFVLVYGILFVAYLMYLGRLIRRGPEPVATAPEPTPEAMQGARPSSVVPRGDAI